MKIKFLLNPNFLLGLFFSVTIISCSPGKELGRQNIIESGVYTVKLSDFSQMLVSELADYNALLIKDPKILSRTKERLVNRMVLQALMENWSRTVDIDSSPNVSLKFIESILSAYPNDIYLKQVFAHSEKDPQKWRGSMRYRVLFANLLAQLKSQVEKPKQKELKEYYQKHKAQYKRPRQVKLQQIVVGSLNNARRIESQLRRGKSFKGLAEKFSITPEAKNGGLTDWINVKTLDIYNRAFNMRAGQQSPVLKSPFGFHIYRLRNKRAERQLLLGNVKNQVEEDIVRERTYELFTAWVTENLSKHPVKVRADLLEQLKVSTEDDS